jgi:hypothetical protein
MAGAQSPALPQTYAFTATSNMMGPMTITVNRNGTKELIELAGAAGNFHVRVLYDFQAHRIYTVDIETKTCTTQEYAPPYAPVQWDPIGGAETMTRDAGSLKPVGQEAVNGIPAKLVESPFPDGKGKYRLWLDEKYGFPVKQTFVTGTQPERVLFEMRKISYAPSAASLFAVPANCTRIGGVTTATGGSAEMSIGVSAEGQKNLGETSARKDAAPAGDPKKLLGKWSFTGKDGSGVEWRGSLTVQPLEADSFDSAKYSNVCDLDVSSTNAGRGASGPCLYDPRNKTLTFAGGSDSSKFSLTAILSADGKTLTQGKWAEASGSGAWSATAGR